MKQEKPEKPISNKQFGLLRYIFNYELTEEHLKNINQISLWSLLYRNYIFKDSNGKMFLTPKGRDTLNAYHYAKFPERKVSSDLTERVSRLLQHSKVLKMRKAS